jgi:AcrR family transcriptional regulator
MKRDEMALTRRERLREATREEIISTAWKQIGEQGVVSLSLRAIAREMGITAPGLYRYYASRDDLVTVLIVEAFNSFSLALETSRDACGQDDHAVRFRAVCRAYFQWALSNPQKYALIFGTPVPGYVLDERAGPAAQRGFLVLQSVIGEAHTAGKISGDAVTIRLPAALKSQYEVLKKYGMPYTPVVTHLALSTWSMIHGMTSLYLYGYLSGFLAGQSESFVNLEIEKMIRIIGFE